MNDPQHEETFADTERKLREIITTLRAQLAAETARADRAEAERAAQIEADAGIVAEEAKYQQEIAVTQMTKGIPWHSADWAFRKLTDVERLIRAQPRSSTALDAAIRAAKVEAWKEAADLCQSDGWGYKDDILALIGEGG